VGEEQGAPQILSLERMWTLPPAWLIQTMKEGGRRILKRGLRQSALESALVPATGYFKKKPSKTLEPSSIPAPVNAGAPQ